ncbi:MAG: hypothetical protein ACRCYK_13780 [Aeromonas hydrophila]
MKTIFVVSALALVVNSGSALAAPLTLNFSGTVSNVTCELVAYVNGVQTFDVDLGTVKPNEQGEIKNIVLKQAPGPNSCDLLVDPNEPASAATKAMITWTSPQFNNQGLPAMSGTAMDAWVEIKSGNDVINSGNAHVERAVTAATALAATGAGILFTARLQGGTQTGPMYAQATVAVNYL